jgi:uncharacterized protein (UPF0332 family)
MTTRAHDILELARSIRKDHPVECGFRSAASRAYYACLHRCGDIFGRAARRPTGQPDSSHEQVIRAVTSYSHSANPLPNVAAAIASTLTDMRRQRNRADYTLLEDFTQRQCEDMFARANAVMKACDAIVATGYRR